MFQVLRSMFQILRSMFQVLRSMFQISIQKGSGTREPKT